MPTLKQKSLHQTELRNLKTLADEHNEDNSNQFS